MKKFKIDSRFVQFGIVAFIVIALSILFNQFITHFSNLLSWISVLNKILSPVIWGLVFAYLLTPLLNIYEKSMFLPLSKSIFKRKADGPEKDKKIGKTARYLSIALTEITLLVAIAVLVLLIVPKLYTSCEKIISSSSDYLQKAYAWLGAVLKDYPTIEKMITSSVGNISNDLVSFISTTIMPYMSGIINNVTNGVLVVVVGAYNILIGVIVSVYVMAGKERFASGFKKILYSVCSVPNAEKSLRAVRFTDKVFMSFLSGKILDSIIIGIICYICCLILKMPYALLISMFVGVTNIIPFFGPFIGAIPSAIVILMESPIKCLIFIIFIFILQQFDGNFLGPRILGSSVGIGGVWILFSIIIGSGLFGFAGMLLGVPVFVIIYTIISTWVNSKLENKGIPTDDEYFDNLDHIDAESGEAIRFPQNSEYRKAGAIRAIGDCFRAVKNFFVGLFGKIFKKKK